MVLDKLGDSLRNALKKITKEHIDKKAVISLSAEIKKALISGDVNVKLAKEIAQKIRDRALKEKPVKTLTAREHTVNIVYEELTNYLGKEHSSLELDKKPAKIMLCGLFGAGKTTTAGKLARYLKKKGLKIALVQTDTWRPAAYAQLQKLAKAVKVDFYGDESAKKPVEILKKSEKQFKKYDAVIIDTAGRDALNEELISEINDINKFLNPENRLLVISGDIGQSAEAQAKKFHETVNINGVIITKLDGTAKGGGALSACSATKARVKFIGVGEKLDAFEEFKPKNFVSQLLGMGDLETLLKKAEEAIDKKSAEKIGKKVLTGKGFNLNDLYEQISSMKKMGSFSQIMNLIPGLAGANIPKDALKSQEKNIDKWKFLMDSMTPEEKENPDIIKASRIKRIAAGAGRNENDVKELLKQYKQMNKMMKMMSGRSGQMKKLMKMMGKGGIPKLPGM